MISIRRILYAIASSIAILLTTVAILITISTFYTITCSILDQSNNLPWIAICELATLTAIAVCSTFGYFNSICTDEKVKRSEGAPTSTAIPSIRNFSDWMSRQLLLGMQSTRFRRGIVRIFSAANLLLITLTGVAVVSEHHLIQILLLAIIYLLFCVFNLIVVFSYDDYSCQKSTCELHLAFRWLREENVISLAVFIMLAAITVVIEQLQASGAIESSATVNQIPSLIAGVSFFHCAAGTVKYFYATMIEEPDPSVWILTAPTSLSERIASRNIQELAKKDIHFILLLILTSAAIVAYPPFNVIPLMGHHNWAN